MGAREPAVAIYPRAEQRRELKEPRCHVSTGPKSLTSFYEADCSTCGGAASTPTFRATFAHILEQHSACRPAVVEIVRRRFVLAKTRARWRIWFHCGVDASESRAHIRPTTKPEDEARGNRRRVLRRHLRRFSGYGLANSPKEGCRKNGFQRFRRNNRRRGTRRARKSKARNQAHRRAAARRRTRRKSWQ